MSCISFLCNAQNPFYELGKSYASEGNYKDAIRLTKECLSRDSNRVDKLDLFFDYISLCEYYSFITEKDSCRWYAQKAFEICPEIDGIEYTATLSNISHSFKRVGLFEEAINYRNEIISIYKKEYGTEYPLLINQYCIISDFYQTAGFNTKALEFAKLAEELAYKLNSKDPMDGQLSYDESLGNLWYIIQLCAEPKEGVIYLINILNVHREAISEDSKRQILYCIWAICEKNNLQDVLLAVCKEWTLNGTYYDQLTGLLMLEALDENIKYDIKAQLYEESLYNLVVHNDVVKIFTERETEGLLILLMNYYGKIGSTLNQYEMAKINYKWRKDRNLDLQFHDIRVLIEGQSLEEEIPYLIQVGEDILESNRYDNYKKELNEIYSILASAYLRIGDNNNAEKYISLLGDDDFDALSAKANYYILTKDLKSLLPISIKLYEIGDKQRLERMNMLLGILMSAMDAHDINILQTYSNTYIENYREKLLTHIPFLSEEEQSLYVKNLVYSNILSYDFFIGLDENENIIWNFPKEAYDYTLLRKGTLLTSQKGFRNAILNSNNIEIQEKWNLLQEQVNTHALQNEIIKRELIQYVSQHDEYFNKFSYSWEQVRDVLKEDELAIEYIITFNFTDFTEMQCAPRLLALIIGHDYTEPKVVVLSPTYNFSGTNWNEALSENNLVMYQMFWQPLEPYLRNIKTVYFSPVENLNCVPMEYASTGDKRVCDKWQVVRVSSTRELLETPVTSKRETIILYGGLQYDVDKDDLIAESRSKIHHSEPVTRYIPEDNLRYGVNYLPGTLKEISDIAEFFASPVLITDIAGTEESFKSLSSSSPDIIHLATHGFYWTDKEINQHKEASFVNNLTDMSEEEKGMLYSGLIFSGANIGLKGGDLPEDVEDGVLTAHELSTLNLSDVDLVVLSACDSGLGATTAEGVYGLQRGFKLSGVNSLLMSLWKVDDYATSLLMTEFYRNYLSGKSKQESLRLSQQALRESAEFSAPYYWASFILLDGLN